MKKILLFLILLYSGVAFSQNTDTPIKGFSVFMIGDSLSKLNSYGYEFSELKIDGDFDYSNKYRTIDNFKNFCSAAKVFYTPEIRNLR